VTVKRGRSGRVEPPTWRRQFTDAFNDPGGKFSPSKATAWLGQLSLLAHMTANFNELMLHWDALALVITAVIAPELVKKFLTMRFGNAAK